MGKQASIIQELVREIHRRCPTLWVWDDLESRWAFATDRSGIFSLPELVVLPSSEEELECLLAVAGKYAVPITPQGARTGTTGGAVPVRGGMVLSLLRMNRIESIDRTSRLAVVQPGLITGSLHQQLEQVGYFYPPDPASLELSTIGGNIAEDAGGPRAVKYGVTHDYLLGATVYLVDGRRLDLGGMTHKNVAGYRLAGLIAGSEGTLGIITRAIVRILPLPEPRYLLLGLFPSVMNALSCVAEILEKEIPAALEFMDRQATRLVQARLPTADQKKVESLLLIELDGSKAGVISQLDIIRRICHKNAAIDLSLAKRQSEANRLWEIRRSLSPALYSIAPTKLNHDVVVPLKDIMTLVSTLETLSEELALPIATFGHVGDGNLHVNIMTDRAHPVMYRKALEGVDRLFREVIRLEGSVSGEHGIGLTKKTYLPLQLSDTVFETMKQIKGIFDPEERLNPGKIFIT